MKSPTFLTKKQLWWEDNKLPNSFLNRARDTIDFIDDELRMPCIDMGEINPLKRMIEKQHDIEIISCDIDLDYSSIRGEWNTIFCFEVLEHLFNPLFALENIKTAMTNDGILYLSVPCQPHFLWSKHHFHEIDDIRLGWLLDRAGFKIVKRGKATIAGNWYNHLVGRSALRYFQKTRLFKLKK